MPTPHTCLLHVYLPSPLFPTLWAISRSLYGGYVLIVVYASAYQPGDPGLTHAHPTYLEDIFNGIKASTKTFYSILKATALVQRSSNPALHEAQQSSRSNVLCFIHNIGQVILNGIYIHFKKHNIQDRNIPKQRAARFSSFNFDVFVLADLLVRSPRKLVICMI